MKKYIMAIDQGTSSTRTIIFDKQGNVHGIAQQEITNYFPQKGWVEQDAHEIWNSILRVIAEIFIKTNITPQEIASIGITNQRETTIIWDKHTGKPIYNALVWQSRQSQDICEDLIKQGYEDIVKHKTGLPIDAYFSASKIRWIFDHVPGAEKKALNGDLLFGTIDTWILWNLSKNKVHYTDYTNASRTMLYNIHNLEWDEELLAILKIPKEILPKVCDSSQEYDVTNANYFYGVEIPICSLVGDQQSSLIGQTCFNLGDMKNTYGTGCFMLLNTGKNIITSNKGLISTIAWGLKGEVTYALEGSVFVAGSAIQWLRDSLKIIKSAKDVEALASKVPDNGGVYMVPAFTGLGTPYWDMDVNASILGLTRGSNDAHIARATLEAIAFQVKDVINVMEEESKIKVTSLKVDGGASANSLLMQFQSDILKTSIEVASNPEATALGAAYLAGLACNFYTSFEEIKINYQVKKSYQPSIFSDICLTYYKKWLKAVQITMNFK